MQQRRSPSTSSTLSWPQMVSRGVSPQNFISVYFIQLGGFSRSRYCQRNVSLQTIRIFLVFTIDCTVTLVHSSRRPREIPSSLPLTTSWYDESQTASSSPIALTFISLDGRDHASQHFYRELVYTPYVASLNLYFLIYRTLTVSFSARKTPTARALLSSLHVRLDQTLATLTRCRSSTTKYEYSVRALHSIPCADGDFFLHRLELFGTIRS